MSNPLNTPFRVAAPPELKPGQPFCGGCGYSLVGATESAKCPECGAPLVDALQRKGAEPILSGKRWRTDAQIFGVPVIDIAFGPDETRGERYGKPRGLIAIGDAPIGGIALGGFPIGVVSAGGLALGVCSLGGLALGAVSALGGLAASLGMSAGGMSLGALSSGGMSVGYFANGGMAVGRYAQGGLAIGQHTIDHRATDPVAAQAFADVAWFFGQGGVMQPWVFIAIITLALAAVIGLLAVFRTASGARSTDPFASTPPPPKDR